MASITPIEDLEDLVGRIASPYRDIYRAAATEAVAFLELVRVHASREGFAGRLAWRGATLVGFAYGFTGLPGQTWRDEMASHLGPDISMEWLEGYFEFAQFGVVTAERRKGLGSRLHDELLTAVPHHRAVLTVIEENGPARGFYSKRDWQELGTGFVTTGGNGPYVIMGRDLTTGLH